MTQTANENARKKNSLVIFIIILLAIIVDEGVNNILIEAVAPIAQHHDWITNAFVIFSMPFALLLGGWSDFHNRRATLLFALICILCSTIAIWSYTIYENNTLGISSLVLKAIGGNAIPIGLAALVDVTPPKSFRSYLAIAICAISIGSWIPIHFRPYLADIIKYSLVVGLICLLMTYFWFKIYKFDVSQHGKKIINPKIFFSFFKKEIVQIFIFIGVPIVALCFWGFFFSEASFYQMLLRGEFLIQNNYYSFTSLAMPIGYYIGTILLFILGKRKTVDKVCIQLGLSFSLTSISFITFFNFIEITNNFIFSILISLFSMGFALFIPSIFSLLSANRHENEQGKIYGLLDSIDSLAIFSSAWFIKKVTTITYSKISFISLILFVISVIIVNKFLNCFSIRHEKNK